MGEDATLDDFATGSGVRERGEGPAEEAADEAEEAADGAAEEEAADEAEEAADGATGSPAEVDDPVPASSWRPGCRCERCGDRADRRWRDGDRLVCTACTRWE